MLFIYSYKQNTQVKLILIWEHINNLYSFYSFEWLGAKTKTRDTMASICVLFLILAQVGFVKLFVCLSQMPLYYISNMNGIFP